MVENEHRGNEHRRTHPPSELPAMSRKMHPRRLMMSVAARASHWA